MNYKDFLFVSDIDGTALVAGKEIPKVNIKSINNFIDKGGRFTVCTGRGSKSAMAFLKYINIKEPVIICNGTCVYDYKSKRVIYINPLPSVAKDIVRNSILKYPNIGIEIVKEPNVFVANVTDEALKHLKNRNLDFKVSTLEEIENDWNKVVYICNPKDVKEFDKYLCNELKDNSRIKHMWVNTNLCELVPADASKAVGLEKLCAEINIKRNHVISIGDYYNDIELLNASKVKIVVDNAPDDLKKMADIVVSDCLNGGLSEAINKFEEIVDTFIINNQR